MSRGFEVFYRVKVAMNDGGQAAEQKALVYADIGQIANYAVP
jgi:hypothetical protein